MKNLASFAPSETADNRNPSPQPPVAGSGNTPGTGEERARQSDLSDAGQGDGVNPAKSPAGYETACPAALVHSMDRHFDSGNNLGVLFLPLAGTVRIQELGVTMSREAALNMAAWIVALTATNQKQFEAMVNEILK